LGIILVALLIFTMVWNEFLIAQALYWRIVRSIAHSPAVRIQHVRRKRSIGCCLQAA
jgi:hypothetical protein